LPFYFQSPLRLRHPISLLLLLAIWEVDNWSFQPVGEVARWVDLS
jgi:hypothetical protein